MMSENPVKALVAGKRRDRRQAELVAIAGLLLLAVVVRGVILFTGQRYLRSDEAVVGLMAKHVVTRGERPVFLYGQPYGGGHAMVAYVAAPLFHAFGPSAILLTGISATVSVFCLVILWIILRRYFDPRVAVAATALYAFSPPVVYQAFLVNGGTETFALALAALLFFLRAYLDGRRTWLTAALCGLFSGLACWGMDYALLYPAVFAILWIFSGGERKWRWLGVFVLGFVAGWFPVILYNLQNDFAHLRYMFAPAGTDAGFFGHFFRALWGVVSGHLAAFFGGDIDDFKPARLDDWIHAGAAMAAVVVLIYRHRAGLLKTLKSHPLSSKEPCPLPRALIPAAFILVYLMMYGVAKFSLPHHPPPRYLLPLCPFVSIAIAWAALGRSAELQTARAPEARLRTMEALGWVLVAFLVARGAIVCLQVGTRPWHEEHRIRTSGEDIAKLAERLKARGIRTVLAPYEIQWRLLFETDERILASSDGISPLPRYAWYGAEVERQIREEGEAVAAVFTADFAFAEKFGPITEYVWYTVLSARSVRREESESGHEGCRGFVVFYPLPPRILEQVLRKNRGAGP